MFRTFISYRPLAFFAALSAVFFALGIGLLVFLLIHYMKTSSFSPHIWSGFVGGSFMFLGLITLTLGLIGDMLVRLRLNQEKIIYMFKKGSPPGESGSSQDTGT